MARAVAAPFAVALAGLAFAGCSRDLSVPPPPSVDRLGIVPAFQAAAPRQGVQFTAAGGAGGYVFAFALGGQLSGADASIDPDGVYTAGSLGSAQDVIEVTDAAGTKANATVSVGQRLAISPAFTGTVPGGRISFQATGGSGGVFSAGIAASGGGVTSNGVYTAGPIGQVTDTVLVTDDFGALAKAEVRIAAALQLYRSETRAVAPHETVAFIAFGGQQPYTYSLATKGSGVDATVDPTSGVYVAGNRLGDPSNATTVDVVQVTDSATVPQSASLQIAVGARLQLEPLPGAVFPGVPAQLVATGGKPPYTFGFAPRVPAAQDPSRESGGNGGNRSHGTVNAASGEYVPGLSPGAVDWFQVTDATGAPAALLAGPPVGGVPFSIGHGVRRCVVGDLNGDRSQDVAFLMNSDQISRIVTAEAIDTAEPFLQSYFVTRDANAPTVVADVAGTGRERILAFGGDKRCNDGQCFSDDIFAYVPDLAGYLSIQQVAGGGSPQFMTVANDPAYSSSVGGPYTHQVALNYGVRFVGEIFDPGSAGTPSTWRFYTDGNDPTTIQTTTSPSGTQRCPWPPGQTDRPLLRFDWPVGSAAPAAPVCATATNFCPTCVNSVCGTCTSGSCSSCQDPNCIACASPEFRPDPLAFAVGDFNGDGKTDLAWILATAAGQNAPRIASGLTAKIYVSFGAGPTGPGATVSFPAPASGWPGASFSFEEDSSQDQSRFVVVHPPPGAAPGTPDALLVRMVESGRPKLVVARPQPVGQAWAWPMTRTLDPNPAGGGVAGVVPYVPAPGSPTSFVAWGANDAQLSGFGLDPGYAFTGTRPLATMPFTVDAVCTPDVNGDGMPDLVAASDNAATAQLVVGDAADYGAATGSFGTRPHLRGVNFPLAVADLDGDGFGDVVAADETGGLSVLWGGGGMLAWGPRIVAAPVSAVAVDDYFGDGRPSVLFQERSGGFRKLHNRGDGTFDPAVSVSASLATGGPASSTFFVWPGALGTAAPGVDAFAIAQNGTFHALLVQAGGIVEVAPKPIPPFDANHVGVRDCWPVPIGSDKPAVVVGCTYENAIALFGATILRPDAAPGGAAGTEPAFTDWVLLTSTVLGTNAFTRSPPAGNESRIGKLGQLPDVPGAALFMMATDKLYAVEVSATPGNELVPGSWTVTPFPVTPDTVGAGPFLGAIGRMDATSRFHAVTGGDGGFVVVKRTNAGYALVQRLSGSGFPFALTPISAPGGIRSEGDAILFFGDFSGRGTNSELVPFLNDGTGKLR